MNTNKYLQLLSKEYPNIQEVKKEMINISTILTLPKGTEFFFSDLHGEYDAFNHLLHSASGVIKNKIDLLYSDELTEIQRQKLAHVIYYPKEHLASYPKEDYEQLINYLIAIAKFCSAKYTQSKIRKKIPLEYVTIIEELLCFHDNSYINEYYHDMIQMILSINQAVPLIQALCQFIKNICIDHIHIIGDIFDRGPRPDFIIDELMKYNQVDIQWGNHDVSWMGAACGNQALIANVIRISLNYNNLDLLENGYGINLRALCDFAKITYKDDSCISFLPYQYDTNYFDYVSPHIIAKMHKAITIIQLKLEGQLIEKYPMYHHYNWLTHIQFNDYSLIHQDIKYYLKDTNLPTVNPLSPLELTQEEKEVMNSLKSSFIHSKHLHEHIKYLYQNGQMYTIMNNNLLFHGCIPMNEKGKFQEININHQKLKGKALLDKIEEIIINAYFNHDNEAIDMMYFLWGSDFSPLFGKSKLCIFEKYFLDSPELCQEMMNPYYIWSQKEETCQMILHNFGIKDGHIINGHVPVKIKNGESPIKANGRLYVIDGGLSKAYHEKTGISGYTLIYDSQHIQLAKHQPYNILVKQGLMCLTPEVEIIETFPRIKNRNCDVGKKLQLQLEDLNQLLLCYQKGDIKESNS